MPTFQIRVTKAKTSLPMVWEELSPEVQQAMIIAGAEKLVNAATTKDTLKSFDGDELAMAQSALANATKKLEALKRGELGKGRKAAGKVAGKVLAEARRLAKVVAKSNIKKEGKKISDYSPKAITDYANRILEATPSLIETAKANIEAQDALAGADVALDIQPDPAKVQANAKKAAEAKEKAAAKPKAGKVSTVRRAPPTRRAPAETGIGMPA